MSDFNSTLRALADAGVEFILVGDVAAAVHGSTRLTVDVDVVYRPDCRFDGMPRRSSEV